MYILNSDKDRLINSKAVQGVLVYGKRVEAELIGGGTATLGAYDSEKRAKEVFESLILAMTYPLIVMPEFDNSLTDSLLNRLKTDSNVVIKTCDGGKVDVFDFGLFRMPEE